MDPNLIFSINKFDKTRNSNNKLFMRHCNTNIRKFSFSYRVVKHWNILTDYIKSAPNLNAFKGLLDTHPKIITSYTDFDE